MLSKSIATEAVFTKTEINNKTIVFFKIISFEFSKLIPLTFPLVEAPLKHLS